MVGYTMFEPETRKPQGAEIRATKLSGQQAFDPMATLRDVCTGGTYPRLRRRSCE